MPKWVNYLIQAVAMLTQIVNAMGSIFPPKYQGFAAVAIAAVQAIVAAIAHYFNPDGTPAELPWITPKTIGTVK
jgi:hypothetical protein